MVYAGFEVRSTEVDQLWDSLGIIFLDVILEEEAEMLSESSFLMPDLTIWVLGADFVKIRSFFVSEGSDFLKLFWLKSV